MSQSNSLSKNTYGFTQRQQYLQRKRTTPPNHKTPFSFYKLFHIILNLYSASIQVGHAEFLNKTLFQIFIGPHNVSSISQREKKTHTDIESMPEKMPPFSCLSILHTLHKRLGDAESDVVRQQCLAFFALFSTTTLPSAVLRVRQGAQSTQPPM